MQGVGSTVLFGVSVQHDLQPGAVAAAEEIPEGDGAGCELGTHQTGAEGRATTGESPGRSGSRRQPEGALEQGSSGQPSRVRGGSNRHGGPPGRHWQSVDAIPPGDSRRNVALPRARRQSARTDAGSSPTIIRVPTHTVGVTGFEPATSSSRTTRATKLRHTPLASRKGLAHSSRKRTRPHIASTGAGQGWATSVIRVASGRQANRKGAYGEVPSPADTCRKAVFPPALLIDRPFTRAASRSQLVISAP